MKLVLGIDPGKGGGIAAKTGKSIYTRKLDGELEELCNWISGLRYYFEDAEPIAYIEDVPKYVGRKIPSSSGFTLGKSYGEVLGVLAAFGIETRRIRPQEWQKAVEAGKRSGRSDSEWKSHLKELAQDLFPTQKVTLWNADALLLLEFGLIKEYGP
jgi:hypothetical protein